ncbi:uncharacterized protein LOC142334584 isoform X2 [Convolutriloba macropyga]|uniref:uncharacterized protein LOC142334584 isoform X2 n=1 Tax=Convolutriloba macropyga TaxID=536237 RepID=UPI003F51E734
MSSDGRLGKILETLESLLLDSTSRQVRVMLVGMKGAGKSLFRQVLFHEAGDERLKEKFNDLEKKQNRSDGIARTCVTLHDRNSVDIAYKRFEEEDYEWEEKSVKVHVVEPDMDIREEKQITAMLAHVDAVAVFLDCAALKNTPTFDAGGWMPFYEKLEEFPPLLFVYNKKEGNAKKSLPASALSKDVVRSVINYEKIISKSRYQILELEVDDVTSEENRSAILNALLRQGTLDAALGMPKPNPKVIIDLEAIPKRNADIK